MRAMIIDRFGPPDVFTPADLPLPDLRPGHVLVRVLATSVNPVDTKVRAHPSPYAPDLPAVLHGDVAGVVVAVGEGVTRWREGDEVYGCAGGVRGGGGALAEFMLADADLLARKPGRLTFAEAAALPLVGITAWDGLIERARVRPGQHVLVLGATGGVGHVAVQLAKWAGATVHGTVSGAGKARVAAALGADVVIDRAAEPEETWAARTPGGEGFDVVFDTVGGDVLASALRLAAPGGQVVSIMTRSVQDLAPMHAKDLSLHAVMMLLPLVLGRGRARHGEILGHLARLAEEGHLRPLLDPHRFPFRDAADAHRHLESGAAIGKVVLEP